MTEDVIAHCQERYQECVAARNARVEAVLAAAEPGDTHAVLAERAGVSRRAIGQRVAAVTKGKSFPNVTDCDCENVEFRLHLREKVMEDNKLKTLVERWEELKTEIRALPSGKVKTFMQYVGLPHL
jgi:hypothetical protein